MIENPKHYLWTEKYRSTKLENYIGNPIFKKDMEMWIKEGQIPNIILSGIAGVGKTTAAKLIVENLDCDWLYINASDERTIDVIRDKIVSFASAASFKPLKIIILDEADYLTTLSMNALRSTIEQFSSGTRFIFTCNYIERITDPIKSRLEHYVLEPPTKKEIAIHCANILKAENIEYVAADIKNLVEKTYPDNRQTLIKLQSFSKTGKFILQDIKTELSKVEDDIISSLKNKDFNSIRKIIINLQLKDYTPLYSILSNRMDDYTNDISVAWDIANSLHQHSSTPNQQICFLGLCSKIINK